MQKYPAVTWLELRLPDEVRSVWERSVGVETLSVVQFRDLLQNFKQVKRDFEFEHFSKFGVRVNKNLTEMYFPVKYITGELIGLRRVAVEDNCLVEDSLPVGHETVLPFMHSPTSHLVILS